MAFKYGFFDAVDGDRTYNADDLSSYFFGLISDGVLTEPADALMVKAVSGMEVKVLPGRAMIGGKYFVNTADYSLTLEDSDYDYARIDRIVLRLNETDRDFVLAVKKGTPAASPQAPALTRSGGVYEISLACIGVAIEADEIDQGNILDERPDKNACGIANVKALEMAVQAVAGQSAVITHSEPVIGTETSVVDIRCNAIADVTPASERWAAGSVAWDVNASKMYGLNSSRQWTAQN